MNKTQDRRIQKTHKLLHEALISLILEKRYEAVTVQEILDKANVGRSTFYTHFRDKDELLLSGLQNLRDMLGSAQAKTSVATTPYEKIIGFSLTMFEHAYEYRGVWKALLGSQAGAVVRQHIRKILADLIREEVGKEARKTRRPDSAVPFDLFVHNLAATFMTALSWWLNQDNPLPPKKMDAVFRALVMPGLKSYVG